MNPIRTDPVVYVSEQLHRKRTSLPPELVVGEEIGRGSNNRVYRATLRGQPVAFRVPRRRSDTQQKGNGEWEAIHALKASQMQVAPAVYQMWIARHATERHPSGLYTVTELFDHDLDTLLGSSSQREYVSAHSEAISNAVVDCLAKLAEHQIFLYDLKPNNLVVRTNDDGSIAARIIDFGRDFSEMGTATGRADANAPTITMLRRLVDARADVTDRDALVKHVLFASMLVQLAATTTCALHSDRSRHRLGRDEREAINGIARHARTLLDSMQGRNMRLLRAVLRSDDVRGVLQHYHGRRNAGTRRTLRFARGIE